MSDENNNEQNQNKQDPENKYSVNSENKYETHGTEEDINDSFTGQDSADDNKKDEILNKDQDKKNDLPNTENEIYNENEYNQNSIKENENEQNQYQYDSSEINSGFETSDNYNYQEDKPTENQSTPNTDYDYNDTQSSYQNNTQESNQLTESQSNINENMENSDINTISNINQNSANENILVSHNNIGVPEQNNEIDSSNNINQNDANKNISISDNKTNATTQTQNKIIESPNKINQNSSNRDMLTKSDTIAISGSQSNNRDKNNNEKKSGVRKSNLRVKTSDSSESKSTQISKTDKLSNFKEKILGWGNSVAGLSHKDKDKSESANIISNTTNIMLNNPCTQEFVDKVQKEIGASFIKKLVPSNDKIAKRINEIANQKAQSLIKQGVNELSKAQWRNITSEAAAEVTKEFMNKVTPVKSSINVVKKVGKGQFAEAGAGLLQDIGWKKLWPAVAANPHIVIVIVVGIILALMAIGAYESISHSTKKADLSDMNKLDQFAYHYEQQDSYSTDQTTTNSNGSMELGESYDEHLGFQNQNKIYEYLNDYFLNVNSSHHQKNINVIKQTSKDILLKFAKKIIVAKQKQYHINDDIFLNYLYEMALGDLFEPDIKVRKQMLLDYIVTELGDRNKIIVDTKVLQIYLDEKFNDYIEMMADFIKSYDIPLVVENASRTDQITDNNKNIFESDQDSEKLIDEQKAKIISEFKENISDDEVIDVDYYEKILGDNDAEIKFENENILGVPNDIYELMYFLYFVDKLTSDDIDDSYTLDIDNYQKLIEYIYDESTKLTLDFVWNSQDAPENKLKFVFLNKKTKDTSASILATDAIKLTYKKIYDDLKKRITSMDEEVDDIDYDGNIILDILAIFNNELEYLNTENIDSNLLLSNSKLAHSYKALVAKTLKFISEMRKYTDKFIVHSVTWQINLNKLKSYLNQIAKGDKNKSQVKEIAQDFLNHLNKLKDMAYATDWHQSGSENTKKVFNNYVGTKVSKHVGYYYGNSLFKDLYIFKQQLKKFSNVQITKTMINPNSKDNEDIKNLADVWSAFVIQLSAVSNSYSDQYIFGTCYDQFPKNISDYFSESKKAIESGEKLGSEIAKIVDDEIIVGLNNLINALDKGLELNNQKFDERKNIMYENIKPKDNNDDKDMEEENDDDIEEDDSDESKIIEIYDGIDLKDLVISDNETRFRKININLNGSEDIYFLFDDISQIKNIKSTFVMSSFTTWLSYSDFYNMFFVDEDYGFDLDKKYKDNQDESLEEININGINTENTDEKETGNSADENVEKDKHAEQIIDNIVQAIVDQYESDSYYADFKDSMLMLSQIYDSVVTHTSEKIIDFGYALKESGDKNKDYISSEHYDFMEIKNLISGENIYSMCSGLVDEINRNENKLIIKYYDVEGDKSLEEEDDEDKYKKDDKDNENDDDDDDEGDEEDIEEYEKAIGGFGNNHDLYIVYEGLNINNNLSVGQEIIKNFSGRTFRESDFDIKEKDKNGRKNITEKDIEAKKSTVIGTASGDTLKIYSFLVDHNEPEKKEFVNPFLICNIQAPFELEKFDLPEEKSPSPSPSEPDQRSDDEYNKGDSQSEFETVSQRVTHRALLKVFGEIIHVAGMIYAIWAIIKFSLGMHDYESVNYQAIWQFFAASILIFGGILLKYISGLK